MNTSPNPPIGSQFFVRWYGNVVPVEVTDRTRAKADTPTWREWVPVLMEIPASDGKPIVAGCRNVCMFHFSHLYDSPDEARVAGTAFQSRRATPSAPVEAPAAVSVTSPADGSVCCDGIATPSTRSNPSPAWQRLQAFKAAHWDAARNHLSVDTLDDFYQLWCDCIAEKQGLPKSEKAHSHVLAVQPQPLPPAILPAAPPADAPQPIVWHKPEKPVSATQLSLLFD